MTEQFDGPVDAYLCKVFQRRETEVAVEQFAQVAAAHACRGGHFDHGDVVGEAVADARYGSLHGRVGAERKISLVQVAAEQDQQLGVVEEYQLGVVLAAFVEFVDDLLYGLGDAQVVGNQFGTDSRLWLG